MQLILQSQRNLFWKIGSRYTKKHYNSKGQEVVNSRTFLMRFRKFEFYEWSPEIIDSNLRSN